MTPVAPPPEQRVLILPPTAKDGAVTQSLLRRAQFHCQICRDIAELICEMERGAGVLLLTDEVLHADRIGHLRQVLDQQPSWSELPIIMLMRGGAESFGAMEALHALPNVLLLERPATMRAVVSAVQAGLRARVRQYQIRDQMEQIARSNAQLAEADEERRHLLDSERAARAEAERASQMKDEFVATVSHELRTPMTAVLGWAQMLRHKVRDEQMLARGLDIIERNARLQSKLIEDLLDMSRIISGKVRLNISPVDSSQLIAAAVESIRHSAEARGIQVHTCIKSTGPLYCDGERIQQVLWNLLSNAVKFTDRGGTITLTAHHDGDCIEMTVQDTGIGIKPEFLPHVFDRFRQSDPSTTRQHGGLGLGLNITKNLVELHGGTITAHSEGHGRGAMFCVRLPCGARLPQQLRSLNPAAPAVNGNHGDFDHVDLTGVRALVVDDDADMLEFVTRLLAESGATVVARPSAVAALELLPQQPFDIVVSDIGMPEMDGYQFIRHLRSINTGSAQVPAVALTAYAGEHNSERAMRAGYQAHITKPIDTSLLLRTLAKLTASRTRPLADASR